MPTYTSHFVKRISRSVGRRGLDDATFNKMKTLGILKPFRGGVKHKEKLKKQLEDVSASTENASTKRQIKTRASALYQNKQDGVVHQINTICDVNKRTSFSSRRTRGVNRSNLMLVNTTTEEKDRELKCLYLNARSVNNKAEEIAELIVDREADLCFITESWLRGTDGDAMTLQRLTPTGFSVLHQPRRGTKRGGGVAIIGRDELKMNEFGSESFATFEHMEVRLHTGVELVHICVLYRPPSTSVSTFLDELHLISGQPHTHRRPSTTGG